MPDSRMEIVCITPCEVTASHKFYIRRPEDLAFKSLALRIKERSRSLAQIYCKWQAGSQPVLKMPSAYMDILGQVQLMTHQAKWLPVKFRNKPSRHTRGGLVGTFIFEGPFIFFQDLMEAGTQLGIGKGCSNGFGRMSFRILSLDGTNIVKDAKNLTVSRLSSGSNR